MSEPLHYRLTTEEWLEAAQVLNKSELIVLYYLRTLDPWGDRHLDLKVVDIAKACHMEKGTASKALNRLNELGWIELEMITIRVRLNSSVKFPTGNQVSSRKLDNATGNQIMLGETSLSSRKLDNATGNFQELEPIRSKGSGLFKTDQTDQTYLNSLSDVPPPTLEREFDDEELIEWVSKQSNQARNPRAYAIKCVKANKKYWQKRYQEYLNRTNISPQIIQENENLSEVERPSEEESVLGRLQCLWALPRKRQECIRRVEEHPEWGIKIDPDRGPVRVEEPVQPEAEAEDTAERFSPLGKILESMKLQQVEEPEDLGDLITMIGFHLKRLGMSKVEAIARMLHYGWAPTHPAIASGSLSQCSADDLLDLQQVLQGL